MNLGQAVAELFPDADPLKDYTVQDDGKGPRLAVWNLGVPRPSPEQLEAAWGRLATRLRAEASEEAADRSWRRARAR